MKLSAEQIEHIDYILKYYYSFEKFDDVRTELLDHIATDVEKKNNNENFEDSLQKSLLKWSNQINRNRNSKYESVPNIISDFWKKLDWKYNYSAIPITLLITFSVSFFISNAYAAYVMYGIPFIGLFFNLYLIRLQKQNKFNTVMSVYAGDQIYVYLMILLFTVVINIGLNVYDGDVLSTPALWVVAHTTVVLVLRTVLMRKNIKIENQLLKVLK